MDTYPGGKGGCFQQIINKLPPHLMYVEPFLGHGAVMLNKRPAKKNFGIDLDVDCLNYVSSQLAMKSFTVINGDGARPTSSNVAMRAPIGINGDVGRPTSPNVTFELVRADSLQWMSSYPFPQGCLVYCDPPYLLSSRTSNRAIYRNEFATVEEHQQLLEILCGLPCMVAISGYWSELYADVLDGWITHSWDSMTRAGRPAREWLWMNYSPPSRLHDYRYLGSDFRERERIRRKAARWVGRFQSLPPLERAAIIEQLNKAGIIL